MKKVFMCFFAISVLSLTIFSVHASNDVMSEGSYYPDVPEISSYNENQRLPYQKALYCYNKDMNDVKHYIVYVFTYDYEILDGFTLTNNESERIINEYFDQYKQYLESCSYEDYAKKDTMLDLSKQMKLFLNTIEESTGVKLFFSLNGLYYNLVDNVNDDNYGSFDMMELRKLYFNMNIDRDYDEDTVFVGE